MSQIHTHTNIFVKDPVLALQALLPAGGSTYPRLPALDVRLHREVLCLSWEFMMESCLCFRSNRMALNSSSSHRSQNDRKQQLQFLSTEVIFS